MERVIAAWDEADGSFLVKEASITGLGTVRGETPEAFNRAVQKAFPDGSSIVVEYPEADAAVFLGPAPH